MSILPRRLILSLASLLLPACAVVPRADPVVTSLKENVERAGAFKSELYLELAAALQSLPGQQRAEQLHAWAANPDNDFLIIILCRMLFDSAPGKRLEPPRLAPNYITIGTTRSDQWPDWPLAFADDVPFCLVDVMRVNDSKADITSKYTETSRGAGESGAQYLEYCLRSGVWTSRKYTPAGSATLDAALTKLLHGSNWGASPPTAEIEQALALQISCDCGAARQEIPIAP